MEDVLIGIVDRSIVVFIPDPASTDGSGKTGLVAANLTVSYTRVETDNDVIVTDVTSSLSNLSALTDAHADWGIKEVSSTLAPGLYRLDIADAVFASGAWYAVVYVMITSSAAAAVPKAFKLVAYNPLDAAGLGLTNLDGAVSSRMATYTQPTGFLAATFPSGTVANTTNITAGTIATVSGNVTGTVGGFTTGAKAEIQTEAEDALIAHNLDHLVKIAVDTDFATTVHLNSVIGQLADNGTVATFDRTTDSQEAIRDRGDAAWLTATGFSTHSAADVWAAGTRTLTAATNITSTGGTITVSSGSVVVYDLTTAAKALIQTEAEDALVTHRLDELLNADSDIDGAAPPTVGSVFHELMTKTAGSFTFDQTTDSVEAIRDRGDASWGAAGAGDWTTDEKTAIRTIFGIPASGTTPEEPTAGAIKIIDDFLDTEVAAIKAKTDNLPASFPANFASLGINASGHVSRVVLVDTLTTYTGNTVQTGDAFARLGAAGAGLTALGDTRLANLDATVSSRLASASYTAPPSAATISTTVWAEATRTITGGTVSAVSDKTGYALSAAGVDLIIVESGGTPSSINLRQAVSIVSAVCCGTSSGMVAGAAGSPVFKNAGGSTTRVNGVLDANGNRTASTLTVPS